MRINDSSTAAPLVGCTPSPIAPIGGLTYEIDGRVYRVAEALHPQSADWVQVCDLSTPFHPALIPRTLFNARARRVRARIEVVIEGYVD